MAEIKIFNSYIPTHLDFLLGVMLQEQQEITKVHTHEFLELIIILGGSGIHRTIFSTHTLSRGDVLVLPPGGEHQYLDTDDLSLFNIVFSPYKIPLPRLDLYQLPGFNALFQSNLKNFSADNPFPAFHLTGEVFDLLEQHLYLLYDEEKKQKPGFRIRSLGIFMYIIGTLALEYAPYCENIKHHIPGSISKVTAHLANHYNEEVSLDSLIRMVAMSRSSFLRAFQAATGTSPMQYQKNLRIEEACRLLRKTDASIAEIAFKVGFSGASHFTGIFRKKCNMTPTEFRKMSSNIK